MAKKNRSSQARAQRKELQKIQVKLKGYINAFYSICYFEEKKLDWNVITEKEFTRLKGSWKAFCKGKGYGDEIIAAFHWDCLLLKVDLIMQTKYSVEADAQELLKLLKKGMTPLEVADYASKNLDTKAI
ncbi:hypothetical protein B620_gp62 [Croceibacter phage P2559S]|uniref:hypothetical protein n=1 Tax=Croceibacter phage P2559S TaxID=1176422 RepID=UPI0002688F24|nr:hypothetical protein B620_gp62 [Croceibacter phage P2559S]AFM54840.1 hypothetical protein P2559S_62 [Croceibacter phage P2559S]